MEERDTNTVAHEPRPRDTLCVYSQADESFYLQLKKSLNLWERQGHVRWLELRPGDERAATWSNGVKRADLILLLLSPDFFPDELCYQTMHLALQERASRQVPVIPILVRAVNWRLSACKDLAIVPRNEQPIASWSLPDEAYASISTDLVRMVPLLPPILSPTRPRLFQARDLPKGYVPRPKAFDEIKSLLLNHEGNQTMAITTALRGAGGFGKTTLALALCHDPEIQGAFPDGILWVELGEQPPRTLDLLNGVLHALEPSVSGAITLEEARDRWRMVLDGRVCLLVIDDIWQAVALEPLLEGGPQCVRLVTTRNDQVLPEEATRIWVDAMETEEAIAVLRRGLPEETQQAMDQPALEVLVARLGYWPLLLSLARGMLANQLRQRKTFVQALSVVEQAYQKRGIVAFHLGNANERQRTADACLEVSLRHLEEFTPSRYHAIARHHELAVFPEDTDIPLAVLQKYWQGTGELESWETEDLCIRLYDLSLLLTCNLSKGTIRLHDVMRNYLVQRAGPNLPALHARFLDVSKRVLGLSRWADLPASQHYFWQHLVRHLCLASYHEELRTILINVRYLAHKALYRGVGALESDLLLVSTSVPESVPPFFSSLHRIIARFCHLLRRAQTEAEMGGLLLSLLGWEPAFAAQRFSLEQELPRPLLLAWHPFPTASSPLPLRTLVGHSSVVTACAVSPDGRFIISASDDNTLKIWNAATGAERLTLSGHTSGVLGCAVSPDGRFIISASDDNTLKIWDAVTGTERITLSDHTGGVLGCAVSPDGRFIISASSDKTLKIWNAATGQERLTLSGHTRAVTDCAMSPDGRFLVSASADRTLKVWDAATGAEQFTLVSHTGPVTGCAMSPDGRFLVSASVDETLKVWDAATGAEQFTLVGHTRAVTGCAVSPDGRFIISASDDNTLKIWDAATGAERITLGGHRHEVTGCAMSLDGRFLVSASMDRTLKVWDATTEQEQLTLSSRPHKVKGGTGSSDGRFLFSESADGTLSIWDAVTGVERLTFDSNGNELPRSANRSFSVWDVATGAEQLTLSSRPHKVKGGTGSSDGCFFFSESADGTLSMWDATVGLKRCLQIYDHYYGVTGCAVSPDGHVIVSVSGDGMLSVWDATTGEERLTFSSHARWGNDCVMSPNGCFLISVSVMSEALKVWDATTGEEWLTLSGHTKGVLGCAVSPDGRFIVSASSDQTLKVWDAASGEERLTLSGHTGDVTDCAVSPNGHFIVSASDDHTLKVWDAVTGAERLTLAGHTRAVTGCAVSPDGRFIISVSYDHTLKVWGTDAGRCLLTFPVDGALWSCAFHPDGEHLVACGELGVYFLRLVV